MHFRESIHKVFEATAAQQTEAINPPDYAAELFNHNDETVNEDELYEEEDGEKTVNEEEDDIEEIDEIEEIDGEDESWRHARGIWLIWNDFSKTYSMSHRTS